MTMCSTLDTTFEFATTGDLNLNIQIALLSTSHPPLDGSSMIQIMNRGREGKEEASKWEQCNVGDQALLQP
jgi:ribosomal protein L31